MANTTYNNVLNVEKVGDNTFKVEIAYYSRVLECFSTNAKAVKAFKNKRKKGWKSAGILLYDECVTKNNVI